MIDYLLLSLSSIDYLLGFIFIIGFIIFLIFYVVILSEIREKKKYIIKIDGYFYNGIINITIINLIVAFVYYGFYQLLRLIGFSISLTNFIFFIGFATLFFILSFYSVKFIIWFGGKE